MPSVGGLRRPHRDRREPEQADGLHDEEREALIPSQPRPRRHMDHGLANAGEQVEDGEGIKRVSSHAAYCCHEHDTRKEWQVLQGVQVRPIEAPDEAAIIGNAEVPNGAAGSEMPKPHDGKGNDKYDGPDDERDEAPERDGHGMWSHAVLPMHDIQRRDARTELSGDGCCAS